MGASKKDLFDGSGSDNHDNTNISRMVVCRLRGLAKALNRCFSRMSLRYQYLICLMIIAVLLLAFLSILLDGLSSYAYLSRSLME